MGAVCTVCSQCVPRTARNQRKSHGRGSHRRRSSLRSSEAVRIMNAFHQSPQFSRRELAVCRRSCMLDNPRFVIYCDQYERAGRPEPMLRWINDRLLPHANINANAAREASNGNLGPAARQVTTLVRHNVMIAS